LPGLLLNENQRVHREIHATRKYTRIFAAEMKFVDSSKASEQQNALVSFEVHMTNIMTNNIFSVVMIFSKYIL
jgi:hypothetical protein